MRNYKRIVENSRLNVCIIKASSKSPFKDYKKSMMGLPQNIFSVAACTPKDVSIEMVDETVDIKVDFNTKADIILIMFSTPDAIRGYEIADRFRKKGKTVVLGGLHVSFMVEEAKKHCDSLLIGEAEGIWEELINDYLNGTLKKEYKRLTPVDMSKINPYPTDIIPAEKYGYSWTVSVSRGCINKCSYCTVHKFFPTYRNRPIEAIVNEIRQAPTDFLELKADNLTADRAYALELFKELEPLNIIWFTALEPDFANDIELVEAAAQSGLRSVLLGIETPSRKSLSNQKKAHLELDKVKLQVQRLHGYDIEVDSAMLFGFDDHDKNIFRETLDFALDIDIDISHGVIPIPFPGTDLFNNLKKEGRILTEDWSKYDGAHLVYKHPNMSSKQVEKGAWWFDLEFQKRHVVRNFKWHERWSGSSLKWRTYLGLAMVFAATFLEMPILFGILYMLWAVQDIRNGSAFILEEVNKDENPILYWTITLFWLLGGVYVFMDSLISNWL